MEDDGGGGNYLWVCAVLSARPIMRTIHSTNNNSNNNFLHYLLDLKHYEKTCDYNLLSNFHVIFQHKRISSA